MIDKERIQLLKDVFEGKGSWGAYYVAGTLCVDIPGGTYEQFDFSTARNPEELYWIARNYLQNKTKDHAFWKDAERIVSNFGT